MSESLQHKLSRVRPPRVQITYDVEIGDAIEKIELPLVVGVMADLSGDNRENTDLLGVVKDRSFVEVDRDNFTGFFAKQEPTLEIEVDNWMTKFELGLKKRIAELAICSHRISKDSSEIFKLSGCATLLEETIVPTLPDQKALPGGIFELNKAIQERGELDDTVRDFLVQLASFMSTYLPLQDGKLEKDYGAKIVTALTALIGMIGNGKNSDDFEKALEALSPKAVETLPFTLKYRCLDDFGPWSAVQQIEDIKTLAQKKQRLSDLLHKLGTNAAVVELARQVVSGEAKEVKDEQIAEAMPDATDFQKGYVLSVFADLVADVADKSISMVGLRAEDDKEFQLEPHQMVNLLIHRISDIHETITNQVAACLHNQQVQALEASWRGLHYLVMNSETGPRLKIRVLNISRGELQKDLEKAVEFDQSEMFKKIYEAEYGTFGGHPYSVLLGDFEFGRSSKDFALMGLISGVAAAAHAPFIAAASPKLFDMETFEQLGTPRALSGIFESQELIKWNSFRKTEDSRYVTLTLPHFMGRPPYDPEDNPAEGFEDFAEDTMGCAHEKFLWVNSAYALTQRITDAFAKYSWCAAIRGMEGGGAVTDLPVYLCGEDGHKHLVCPTEVSITDRREKELSDLGFISLVHRKGEDLSVFFGGQTTQLAKVYNKDDATANARLSAVLPYMLAASRFAHYIKVIVRDKVGGFLTADNVQTYLNTWIGEYVLGKDDAGQEVKARFPLREARVDVSEVPGKPGVYSAIVYLRPHFQLEELTTSIRLVASLPPPAE